MPRIELAERSRRLVPPPTQEQREARRLKAERSRAAKRKAEASELRQGRPTVLVRVSLESIYLPGQVVELIGGQGNSDGGCVRIRNPKTRGEYFLPKIFLESL